MFIWIFVEANWIFGCISVLQNIYAICVNQSILKISPGCSLEGLMLKLKLQYFGQLMWRVDSLEKTLMLGGIGAGREGDDNGWDGWMASPTWWTWVWVNSGSWWWTGRSGVLRFMGLQSRTRLSDWTEQIYLYLSIYLSIYVILKSWHVFWLNWLFNSILKGKLCVCAYACVIESRNI